jgi:hypothetical protein
MKNPVGAQWQPGGWQSRCDHFTDYHQSGITARSGASLLRWSATPGWPVPRHYVRDRADIAQFQALLNHASIETSARYLTPPQPTVPRHSRPYSPTTDTRTPGALDRHHLPVMTALLPTRRVGGQEAPDVHGSTVVDTTDRSSLADPYVEYSGRPGSGQVSGQRVGR